MERGCAVDGDEVKYVSGLSTILVATIQEAKDRISQIEYIFCNQLYPNFQSKSKTLQRAYEEARKEAQDAWKEKEKDLLLRVGRLEVEKQEALEKERCWMLQREEQSGEFEKERSALLTTVTSQQDRIDGLERRLVEKIKEVDDVMDLQRKMLTLSELKDSRMAEKDRQLKEQGEKNCQLLAKVKSLEGMVGELQEKAVKGAEGKEYAEERIRCLQSKLAESQELLIEHEKEKKELMFSLKYMEDSAGGLREKLGKKTEELDEERALLIHLHKQIDLKVDQIWKQEQKLKEAENEKKLLLDKVTGLEKKVNELQENLNNNSKLAGERCSPHSESKSPVLMAEKEKFRNLLEAYKRLKSQYNYALRKLGLTEENMVQRITSDLEEKDVHASVCAMRTNQVKIENGFSEGLEDANKVVKSVPVASFHSPTSNFNSPKCPLAKSAPVIGSKRPGSSWIDTRSRQGKNGFDPHDDFLDTPLENVRANLNKSMKEEAHDFDAPVQQDTNPDSSDDEPQDMKAGPGPGNEQMAVPAVAKREFKFVETVRKKADRENLKGVECKQCKKFYDAVLPNGGKDTNNNHQHLRCEHHEGVSRHRYKYVPPMTPEGFWNIGFESEL